MFEIRRALISVTNKNNIKELCIKLKQAKVEIICTSGTHRFLKDNLIDSIKISDFTEQQEILNGRVKTLHHYIFAGILIDPQQHLDDSHYKQIKKIDLVVVDLYDFKKSSQSNISSEQIIESIDIGGISLIRASAKNYKNVCVLTDENDFQKIQISEQKIETDLCFRKEMAKKAFALSSEYDSMIYNWLDEKEFKDNLRISDNKKVDFRYGENPHQKSCIYGKLPFTQLQGKELSYNNIVDAESAYDLVLDLKDKSVAIIKHGTPCGACTSNSGLESYNGAIECSIESVFGGIVALNCEVDKSIAQKITEIFTEIIIAPKFTQEAIEFLSAKPNIRVLLIDKRYTTKNISMRSAFGSILVQQTDNSEDDHNVVSVKKPSLIESEDMIFAMKICKHSISNAIVVAKNKRTIGIGSGQTSRINSVNQALLKAFPGCVMASDGFFPFTDGVEKAFEKGINAIIQPGGSIKDKLVIDYVNKKNISMVFTNKRHFKH